MPIKPIDMQVLMPQVQKATKAHAQKQHRPEAAMSEQTVEQQKDDTVKRNTVANLEKKDDHKLKNDLEKRSPKKRHKKKKKKKDDENENKPVVKHGFDMKV